ncbi:MAG: hypothetical protein HRU33_11595 [Rhodobacteraceae bacterium]|nr:hypothetical protein [Paracoccaceae bacterium]
MPEQPDDGAKNPANVCVINADDRQISIRLNSIHQAKGQIHIATLFLSTFQNHHSSDKNIDWLFGIKRSGGGVGSQNLARLK